MPKDKIVDKYITKVTIVNNDPEFINYMSEEEDQRKIRNTLKKEGYKEGISKGIAQGMAQGIEQGSLNKSKEIAKNLLSMNISIEDIIKATGLPIDKIQNLK